MIRRWCAEGDVSAARAPAGGAVVCFGFDHACGSFGI
jgi:hypothetical protein